MSIINHDTLHSMNRLFSEFFKEFWRRILGGVRDYLGEVLGGFYRKFERKLKENHRKIILEKKSKNQKNPIK